MAEQQVVERRGREGGRWINERPSSEEFATWFKDSMSIDPALKIEDYIGGVVLIPAVDTRAKYVSGWQNGKPMIDERPEMSYIPYAKVETRTNYFWDLLGAHEEWVGVVERMTPPRLPVDPTITSEELVTDENGVERATTTYRQPGGIATMVHQLPDGFSIMSVPVGDNYSHFLLCTIRVAIYRADEDGMPKGVPLRQGQGSKQVPLSKSYNNRVWADADSLMKAETGALGRALGFAGIFVIPGSGVATAEDMLESASQGETPTQAAAGPTEAPGPAAPTASPVRTGAEATEDEEAQMKKRALNLFKELRGLSPAKAEEFTSWAHNDRKLNSLNDARGAMLRGVVRKLERLVEEAKADQQAAETPAPAPAAPEIAEAKPEPEPEPAASDGSE